MAWNEPGGGNKDPWGNKGNNNQGPPDLDEVAKKVQESLNKIFGGKSGGSGGSDGGSAPSFHLGGGVLGLIAVVLLGGWFSLGLYEVDQQERAVVLRLGEFYETKAPGLRWNPLMIDEVNIVNVTRVRTHTTQGLMLTQDENIVDVNLAVQYVIGDPQEYLLNVRDPEVSLTHATDSALRHVVGSVALSPILSEGREALGTDIRVRLQEYLDRYQSGLRVVQLNLESTQPPQQVQVAFDDVIKAREDEQRVKNQAETYANGVIPEARGRAQRVLEEANAYKEQVIARARGEADRFRAVLAQYEAAPEVTRQRLYIEAVEEVMANSSKVLVDVDGGNNMMMLPLDRLAQAGAGSAALSSRANTNISGSSNDLTQRDIRSLTDQVISEIRARQADTTTRGDR
ncbi:FtsH protease activity modulator HflK [Litorivicinus lipolyticus]|uniref:Protein HflK n=1 Tax=Litorivicinus lipolyticus TaxID=418701 RepID=A0A5Q2QGP8_9GAMM|nr:FtsH protease activity modulator HflK [Litorivicinus lipolyticus]QGG81167.1 FtsH protease activity modulator HflK [Litorivicinus lipolyticus]